MRIQMCNFSLIKRNKLLILLIRVTEWNNLKNITLNEKNSDTKEFMLPDSIYVRLRKR